MSALPGATKAAAAGTRAASRGVSASHFASRVLVAGIGNIFLGDDGFGPAVVARIPAGGLPASVVAHDFGIGGVHLAYELLSGIYGCVVMVDAVPMGEPPGTLALIEAGDFSAQVPGSRARPWGAGPGEPEAGARLDAHSMSPASVLAAVSAMGGEVPRALIVGCQPGALEASLELSPAVESSLDAGVELVVKVSGEEAARLVAGTDRTGVG
ncbi:MAG: hydrogenase maturation protease [Acidimicrobiales bacterium]